LLRDLENPNIWTETYRVPTWVDYIRHNLRRKHADAEITEKLRALHRGENRPKVHRMIERQTVPFTTTCPSRKILKCRRYAAANDRRQQRNSAGTRRQRDRSPFSLAGE
jgi:hypothetical protein